MSLNPKDNQLHELGFKDLSLIRWNCPRKELYEKAVQNREGSLTSDGALLIVTSPYTGRLPNDKFIVKEPSSEKIIDWGKVNRPIDEEVFFALQQKLCNYLSQKEFFVQEAYCGADTQYTLPVRVISERASAALFTQNMLILEKDQNKLNSFAPEYTIIHAPHFKADPAADRTRSDAFIMVHFGKKIVLIGGTLYLGEIKKSIFSIMNYILPQKNIMPMHSSANYGKDKDDVAVFFGLSGTGKTTLSADIERTLIGDDEHGWSDSGVFNFEGGCYAKVIRLSAEKEPEIFTTLSHPETILENVAMDPVSKKIDLDDGSITENTRASYPIELIPNMTLSGMGGHPKNIIMLTCDAFGVLPPVAALTKEQAMYHFLSGYTAKVAGTEAGVMEPQATFSACFGAPFMPLHPTKYADLLGKKIDQHGVHVWLVNTGWSGGGYGEGARMDLTVTRAIVTAILNGELSGVETKQDPYFGLHIPVSCPGVNEHILNPEEPWSDKSAYEKRARKLAEMFIHNFKEIGGDAKIAAAGPIC